MTPFVYTAIAGEYPIQRTDIQCFGSDDIFRRSVMEAKRYKILPHLYAPKHDVTIWVDGNIWLLADAETVVSQLLGNADLAAFAHPYRETVWQEFATLKDDPRFDIPYLQKQLRAQKAQYCFDRLPPTASLYECNVLIRRNNERVNRMMDAWWSQICRWQWRDQVSFPYVVWKHPDVTINRVAGNVRDHPLFRYVSQY